MDYVYWLSHNQFMDAAQKKNQFIDGKLCVTACNNMWADSLMARGMKPELFHFIKNVFSRSLKS